MDAGQGWKRGKQIMLGCYSSEMARRIMAAAAQDQLSPSSLTHVGVIGSCYIFQIHYIVSLGWSIRLNKFIPGDRDDCCFFPWCKISASISTRAYMKSMQVCLKYLTHAEMVCFSTGAL